MYSLTDVTDDPLLLVLNDGSQGRDLMSWPQLVYFIQTRQGNNLQHLSGFISVSSLAGKGRKSEGNHNKLPKPFQKLVKSQ